MNDQEFCPHAPTICDSCINERVARKLGLCEPHEKLTGHKNCDCPGEPENYCHSIEAAWEIVLNDPRKVTIRKLYDGKFSCEMAVDGEIIERTADTAPMAICKAFLKLNEE